MDKIIDEIISQVLRDNLSILKAALSEYESVLQKHAQTFFSRLKDLSSNVTYGLQLGLTKKFCEFVLKKLADSTATPSGKNVDAILKQATSSALQSMQESLEGDTLVYIMYRSLKKSIDKEFEQPLELCK